MKMPRFVNYLGLRMKTYEQSKLYLYFWLWECQMLMLFVEINRESFGGWKTEEKVKSSVWNVKLKCL